LDKADINLEEAFQWAMEAVLEAGKVLKKGFRQNKGYQKKGAIDLVTEWDYRSQETVISRLKSRYPDFDVLAEEAGMKSPLSPCYWVLDPLDGTTNFVHGFPFFCVSLALMNKKTPLLGLVLNPVLKEIYWAVLGKGAFFNGRPIKVSAQTKLSESLLATGFPYNIQKTHGRIIETFEGILIRSQGVRRPGSAALDLCWVARGVMDGFWEQYLKPWDTAAGWLIVKEAGGKVSDFSGHPYHFHKKQILATNGLIHREMIEIFAQADRRNRKWSSRVQ
jgi:myo-inositol-1(or 4)-monophosphatase